MENMEKRRSSTFLPHEAEILVAEVIQRITIIEGGFGGRITNQAKQRAWEMITLVMKRLVNPVIELM